MVVNTWSTTRSPVRYAALTFFALTAIAAVVGLNFALVPGASVTAPTSATPKLEYSEGLFLCPGSPKASAFGSKSLNAWARMSVTVKAPCASVKEEMTQRVMSPTWLDPHNGGLYSIVDAHRADVLSVLRKTGDRFFTDAATFVLRAGADDYDTCDVHACSESQGGAGGDFSTNFCNMKMLFCGSDIGCVPEAYDFAYTDEVIKLSAGASAEADQCFGGNNMGKMMKCKDAKDKEACLAAWKPPADK